MGKRLLTLLLAAMAIASSASAQRWARRHEANDWQARLSSIESKYAARLDTLRDSIFSLSDQWVGREGLEQRERLFMPITFYSSVAQRLFSIDGETLPVDTILLREYLRKPSLVGLLKTSRDVVMPQEVQQPIRHSVRLTDKVDAEPYEPAVGPQMVYISKPHFWTFGGEYNLQFLQNYVSSNWYKGGESNYSLLGALTMQANFNNKQKVKWDNKLELKYGLQTSRGDSLHSFKTTQDLMRLTSKLGIQAHSHWYYTLQMLAYTQFSKQYKSNDPRVYSEFLSPFNLNISLGMDYSVSWLKKKLTGSIHLAPIAYNFRYVDRSDLATRYGLDEGRHTLNDFGSEITVDLTWALSDMIKWQTRLYGYTTYHRMEAEWENTISFKFNRWISSQIFVYPRFDDAGNHDDHHGYFQLKEYMSLGFSYSF